MKSKIGIYIIMAALVFAACEPVEKRNTLKGTVTDAEIDQYVKIVQQERNGKKSNFFSFTSDGLKANTSFKHGMGTFVGASSNGWMQCYLVAGDVSILLSVLNPDGTKVTKSFSFKVEEAFDVAPEWAIFCGTGSKVWEWDTSFGDGIHGMGDVFDDRATWWTIGKPEERVAGEGVGATMTFAADGTTLTKLRTDGTSDSGTFSFKMRSRDGFEDSLGEFTTSLVTVLAGVNSKDAGVENKFEIMQLDDDQIHLLVIDMDGREAYKPDSEGWGQATHWRFRAKK